MIRSVRDAYRLAAIGLYFEPVPVSGQRVAMAYTDHHSFVPLVTVLRVLVGADVGKCYSKRNAHSNNRDELMGGNLNKLNSNEW